jgi:hypothetical protein
MVVLRLRWQVVGALLAGGTLLAQQATGDAAAPRSTGALAEPAAEVSGVDFEAEVDATPRLPAGAERADGLGDAVRQAEHMANATSRKAPNLDAAPPFVQKVAAAMRARISAMTMMANDATAAEGEVALHKAAGELDLLTEPALRDAK